MGQIWGRRDELGNGDGAICDTSVPIPSSVPSLNAQPQRSQVNPTIFSFSTCASRGLAAARSNASSIAL